MFDCDVVFGDGKGVEWCEGGFDIVYCEVEDVLLLWFDGYGDCVDSYCECIGKY